MRKLFKNLTVCLAVLLSACSSQAINPTVYSYQYNDALANTEKMQKVLIASINFDKPSRYYLNKNSGRIDRQMTIYLENKGIKVRSSSTFDRYWKKMQREYGNLKDASTGKYTKKFKTALSKTMDKVFKGDPNLQYMIFTDLISTPVTYNHSATRMAQWHGVTRKLKVQGLGNGVKDDFDWSKSVDAISLSVYVFNRQQQLILHNIGGLQIAQALELHNNTGKFKRRKDLLRNEKEINEAIKLALHPLIQMKNYPLAFKSKQ
ncbi:MAG: hypothetical protein HRU20_12510 [Pseudomonadales bacterium]|nr:hypothetical protein [Pseudomonadales bacterium]